MSTGILIVDAGRRRVGLAVDDVVGVERMVAVTPIVDSPDWIDGVVDVRGEIAPVVCLATRLGLEQAPPTVDDHLVVMRAAGTTVALRVARASGVTPSVPDEDILLVENADALEHLARTTEGLLLIPNLAQLLDGLDLPAITSTAGSP